MATGATVPGLYSHIAHSMDKEEGEIPQPFKGAKPKQTRGRGKPKGNPQEQRQNPPKAQEADETYTYDSPNNYYHNDNYTATSQSWGHRAQYSQCQFQNYRFQRGTFQQNRTQYGNNHKPYFQGNQTNSYRGRSCGRGPQQFRGHGHGRANY